LNASVREWLPSAALSDARIGAVLAEPVEGWSSRWFAGRRLSLLSVGKRAVRPAEADASAIRAADGVSLRCESAARVRLVGWALGMEGWNHAANAADRLLVDSLCERMLDDLLAVVVKAVGAPRGNPDTPSVAVAIGLPGHAPLLTLLLPGDTLILACKAAIGSVHTKVVLDDRLAALGDVPVPIEAWLAGAALPIEQIGELAPGDVLVLDATFDTPAGLRIGGGPAFAHARLSSSEGRLALTLQS